MVLILSNIVFVFALFVFFCIYVHYNSAVFVACIHFLELRFSPFQSLTVLLFIYSISFVTPLLDLLMFIVGSPKFSCVLFFVALLKCSSVFFYFSISVMFFNLKLRMYLFVFFPFVFCCWVVTTPYLPFCRSFFTVVCFNLSCVWLILISLLVLSVSVNYELVCIYACHQIIDSVNMS